MGRLIGKGYRRGASQADALARPALPRYLDQRDGTRSPNSRALRRAGQLERDDGAGPRTVEEQHSIDLLVRSGRMTRAEANAYLSQRYPESKWAGGRWGDQALGKAEDAETLASLQVPSRRSSEAPAGNRPMAVDQLPESYERGAIQAALESVAEQVAQNLRQERLQPPTIESHALDGGSIAPGSIPVDALDLRDAGRNLVLEPGADEAIIIRPVASTQLDRWVVDAATGRSGPGRVWHAEATYPQRSRVGVGPQRYRVVQPGMRFGVMSLRLQKIDLTVTPNPPFEVLWGIVLTGIPHSLGRPPEQIEARYVGDCPVSYRAIFDDGSSGATPIAVANRLPYWEHSNAIYRDLTANGKFPWVLPFGTDAKLAGGNPDDLAPAKGMVFQLITGRDAEEVTQQLNSMETFGCTFPKQSPGPTATLPDGLVPEGPAPLSVLEWDGNVAPYLYTHLIEPASLTTSSRIVQGVPFRPSDCQALAPTDTTFSVVMYFDLRALRTVAATWGSPLVWHENGIQTTDVPVAASPGTRTWAIDIIVS